MDSSELGFGQQRPGTARQPSQRSLVPQQEQRPGTAPSMQRQGSSNSVYNSNVPAESSDLLLPPSRSRPSRRFRDDLSPVRSPSEAGFSSRRTSWTSEGSRDSKYGPFASPFDDSRAPSRAGSDDEGVNTQTVSEKYNILPSAGLLLFPEDVEKDDYLHNPDPNEKEKLHMRDCFSKRGFVNVGGLVVLIGGILVLFIAYPILTFVQRTINPGGNACSSNPDCLSDKMPLMNNIRRGLIDPDTPKSAMTRKSHGGKSQTLVFSDEFNDDGRTFYDGDDPYFQGVDLCYHDECDAGITANQSDPDGLNALPGMRLPACTCSGEDHPSPGNSRSAPEIDALEASVSQLGAGNYVGSVSQSCQIAPFDTFYQPNTDYMELYDTSLTAVNVYQGGVYQQAISLITWLNNDWYNGKQYQKYAFEYEPGETGYITWYVGDSPTWTLDARAIGPNGNIGQRTIPQEPMAIIANLGMSNGFSSIDMTGIGKLLPATMRLDYIRIYQDDDNPSVSCDPPGYPTTDYIANHPELYKNPNITLL
ncbi:MAG: hypothetical protein Q9157_005388 [Trypethelium eluteriae]